ncbi:CapA family protein [Virgibacillus sp. MG-45]|uniref:CapA family protein n=1 Tax=Virgibacillus sp. MG-45 TaxID=3102791 RepID=UPI002ED9E671
MRNWGTLIIICLLIGSLLVGCSWNNDTAKENKTVSNNQEKPVNTREEKQVPAQEITLAAIGDMLIHEAVYVDAKQQKGYDFKPMLANVKPFLAETTVSIANQETMIGGEAIGLSTYPSFNSPYEVGDALKDAGVDVVSIANNHTLDRGEKAIQNAIKHWEAIDMMYTGAYRNKKDRDTIRVYETEEGISLAFLSYTYGTNGIPVPNGKDYLVNLIHQDMIASEITEAKKKADVIVLSLHFGNEYERMPSDAQKQIVQYAADQGVHVVIGHHPHVLQPMEWVKGKDGNRTFVAYSLGNFLSGQDEFYRRIGGIVQLTITKKVNGTNDEIELSQPTFIPTFVKFENDANFEVVPMYQLHNDELAGAKKHYAEIKKHLSQWMPELEFKEE